MTIIVNPGSDPVTKGDAWTNTFDAALGYATEWHERMRAEGLADIEMLEPDRVENDGRWTFRFRHTVTGVVVELRHHGVAPLEAYRAAHIFGPLVTVRSMREFRERYFPMEVERERVAAMTPAEYGAHVARRSIEDASASTVLKEQP